MQGCHTKFWALGTRIHCGPPMNVNYWKIADIQAHSAAPSAALRACRSAIFEKSLKSLNISNPSEVFWKTYVSMSVMLKLFHVRDRPKLNEFTIFFRYLKNSRSTSSQRGTRCHTVSLYICHFSIVKAWKEWLLESSRLKSVSRTENFIPCAHTLVLFFMLALQCKCDISLGQKKG